MNKRINLMAIGLGSAVAVFLWPVSLPGALAAFVLVQILDATSVGDPAKHFRPDRFRESQRTAERVLDEMV